MAVRCGGVTQAREERNPLECIALGRLCRPAWLRGAEGVTQPGGIAPIGKKFGFKKGDDLYYVV